MHCHSALCSYLRYHLPLHVSRLRSCILGYSSRPLRWLQRILVAKRTDRELVLIARSSRCVFVSGFVVLSSIESDFYFFFSLLCTFFHFEILKLLRINHHPYSTLLATLDALPPQLYQRRPHILLTPSLLTAASLAVATGHFELPVCLGIVDVLWVVLDRIAVAVTISLAPLGRHPAVCCSAHSKN